MWRKRQGANRVGSGRRWFASLFLALLSVVVVLVAVVVVHINSEGPNERERKIDVVAFIGDSYTGGSRMGGAGPANYTVVLGREKGWRTVNAAVGGTGYVHRGPMSPPFEEAQLGAVVSSYPDLVIVAGSRNDGGEDVKAVEDAAVHLYSSLRRNLPDADVLVVGPIWTADPPSRQVIAARDAVRVATGIAGVPFVDPVGEGWFAGHPELIGEDGTHPTDAGHRLLAERMGAAAHDVLAASSHTRGVR